MGKAANFGLDGKNGALMQLGYSPHSRFHDAPWQNESLRAGITAFVERNGGAGSQNCLGRDCAGCGVSEDIHLGKIGGGAVVHDCWFNRVLQVTVF
jgi:hypothetical protein